MSLVANIVLVGFAISATILTVALSTLVIKMIVEDVRNG